MLGAGCSWSPCSRRVPGSRPVAPAVRGRDRPVRVGCVSPAPPCTHAGAVRWLPRIRSWWPSCPRLDRERDGDEAALPACQVSVLADASRIQTLGIPGAAVTHKGMRSSQRLHFARRQLLLVHTENPCHLHPRTPVELTQAEPSREGAEDGAGGREGPGTVGTGGARSPPLPASGGSGEEIWPSAEVI